MHDAPSSTGGANVIFMPMNVTWEPWMCVIAPMLRSAYGSPWRLESIRPDQETRRVQSRRMLTCWDPLTTMQDNGCFVHLCTSLSSQCLVKQATERCPRLMHNGSPRHKQMDKADLVGYPPEP